MSSATGILCYVEDRAEGETLIKAIRENCLYLRINEMRKLSPAKMLDPVVFIDLDGKERCADHLEYNDYASGSPTYIMYFVNANRKHWHEDGEMRVTIRNAEEVAEEKREKVDAAKAEFIVNVVTLANLAAAEFSATLLNDVNVKLREAIKMLKG